MILFLIILEKRHKSKQSCRQSLSVTKKRTSTNNFSSNKENVIEIVNLDEDLCHLEQQKRMNDLVQDMLNIQKQKNEELEKEIMLLEKRNRILNL